MPAKPRVLFPLPDRDFDPTEAATPWRVCADRGWATTFATERGDVPQADPHLLRGFVFGPLGALPMGLRDHRRMVASPEYRAPVRWSELAVDDFDALLLTGGHAPGMRQFLESREVQACAAGFLRSGKPVGAICHGVLVLARATDPATGRSALADYRTTSLTKLLEVIGYASTFWLYGRRFRTYDAYVEDEVRAALRDPRQYTAGWLPVPHVVTDRNLVTSRYWLFDAMAFSNAFAELVASHAQARGAASARAP